MDRGTGDRRVAVALEVVDSRYAAFGFRLPDVVADNTSAAGFLLGRGPLARWRSSATRCAPPCTCRSLWHAEVSGCTAGAAVLAGALTDAVPIRSGAVHRAEIRGRGAVDLATEAV